MVHWTDKHINWQSLSAREINHLINTWGRDDTETEQPKVKRAAKAEKTATKSPATAPAKTESKPRAKKHTGADGDIKFVASRNLYVGFADGGRIVVTRATAEACAQYLERAYNLTETHVVGA